VPHIEPTSSKPATGATNETGKRCNGGPRPAHPTTATAYPSAANPYPPAAKAHPGAPARDRAA
jgi:hypothetical protein